MKGGIGIIKFRDGSSTVAKDSSGHAIVFESEDEMHWVMRRWKFFMGDHFLFVPIVNVNASDRKAYRRSKKLSETP